MRLFFTLSLFCLLAGCTQNTPFYPDSTASPLNSVRRNAAYDLAFVEFGEQGSYQDPTQLENARDLIKNTARPLVVTYVHGWQNNAVSGDATKFANFLQELARSEIVRAANLRVVGVYLGWRGQLTKVEVAKELTFFSRKAAAERLASNFDCYDAIATVSETARKYHAADAQYTILLGHSFGGLVVERAVAHAINAEIHGGSTDPAKALPADLILLLNPASDSILTRQMIAALYSRHLEDTRAFVVSLTSTADDATGLAFPAADEAGRRHQDLQRRARARARRAHGNRAHLLHLDPRPQPAPDQPRNLRPAQDAARKRKIRFREQPFAPHVEGPGFRDGRRPRRPEALAVPANGGLRGRAVLGRGGQPRDHQGPRRHLERPRASDAGRGLPPEHPGHDDSGGGENLVGPGRHSRATVCSAAQARPPARARLPAARHPAGPVALHTRTLCTTLGFSP